MPEAHGGCLCGAGVPRLKPGPTRSLHQLRSRVTRVHWPARLMRPAAGSSAGFAGRHPTIFPGGTGRRQRGPVPPPPRNRRHNRVAPTQSAVRGAANECVKYTWSPSLTPSSNHDGLVTRNEFHPTCGTLKRGETASASLPVGASSDGAPVPSSASRRQMPGSSSSPGCPGASLLPSNSHCMPTQIPSSGRRRSTWSRMAVRQSGPSAAVTAKLPTPGMMTPSANVRSAGVPGVVTAAPRCASALRTDVRFPAP